MDVAHYADALKEQLLTAWAVAKPTALAASDAALSAASGAADLLEPMSAKVMVAQALCSSECPHHMKGSTLVVADVMRPSSHWSLHCQVQLHDYVVRLSAVPAVQGVLESISEAV